MNQSLTHKHLYQYFHELKSNPQLTDEKNRLF